MIDSKISASLMCADQFNLEADLRNLVKSDIDYLHLDIMDGHFVPNITLGIDLCIAIKDSFDFPIDIHLLVEDPEWYIARLHFGVGDIVGIHAECSGDKADIGKKIKDRGACSAIILNPSTPIESVEDFLDCYNIVSLMMVEPGFAGLCLDESILEKIAYTRKWLDSNGYEKTKIEVDGNVSYEHASIMRENGAEIFVAGSSSIFDKRNLLEKNIAELRSKIA